MTSKHDFVVVGGGLAGLVVAARLTEDPNISVLVLEAGEDHTTDPRIRTPASWPSLLGSDDFDWNYRTVPQEGLDGKAIPLSQGKLLGGSSAINGQAFVANSKAAVDAWAQFGSPGWDWQSMAPYFRKFHTLSRPSPAASEHLRLDYINDDVRATSGPIQASFPEETDDPLPTAWVDTLSRLGWPASGDPFSGDFVGGYINAMSIEPDSRTRSDAVTAYYAPAKARPNLHVVTGTVAQKIIFDTSNKVPKAVGVLVQKGGKITMVEATKEVILAAGTVGTPKLLELSGVGDQSLLESFGIPVVVHNPNVGENLQDHPNVGVSFEVAEGIKTMDGLSRQEPEAIGAAMQEYMTTKKGPFALGGNYAGSLIPVPDFVEGPEAEATLKMVLQGLDNVVPTGDFSPYHAEFVRSILGRRTEGAGNLFTYAACGNFIPEGAGADIIQKASSGGNFFTICAALLFPLSRGSSHITSSDPAETPIIDPKYLSHPLDLEVIARFVRYIDTIVRAEPLAKLLLPGGRRSHGAPTDLTDLEQAKTYARQATLSCWHLTSTCAMLPRERGGVVDPNLFVYGVEGLRIVDASVIPLATRGNSQTTVYAVAERAADLIKGLP